MSIYRMRTEFGKHLKIILGLIALVFVVGAVYQFGAAPTQQPGESEEAKQAIATANGLPITRSEFDSVWVRASKQAADSGIRSTLQLAELRGQIFQQLLQSRLMLAAARQMGVAPTKKDVEAQIDELVVEHLKQNRRAVLGQDLPKKQDKLDPRKDKEYRAELARNKSSLRMQEEMARVNYPPGIVETELASANIQEALKKKAGTVTDKDVDASYDVYSFRQIVLQKGRLPDEQTATKAKKVAEEAKGGTDFAKLANDNSDLKAQGVMEYSFDSFWMAPPEVGEKLKSMKPGQVSDAVKTDTGWYVLKLEGVNRKLPEKYDKKVKDERRKQVQQMREMMVAMDFQKKMRASQKVTVSDPEMAGYYRISEAQMAFGDQEAYKKNMKLATASFQKAVKENPGNDFATAKLAQLYQQDGKTKEAIQLLYQLLESPSSTAQGADLRMMLGDLLVASGTPEDKAKAIEQYKLASESAVNEKQIHQQLVMKFQQLGKPDLAAQEQKWIADREKLEAELQAKQKETAPVSNKTNKPKPGG